MRPRLLLGLVFALITLACATLNPQLERIDESTGYRFERLDRPATNSEETFIILTFSGGGTRAAALAFGVMQQLEATKIENGSKSLLDEIDVISSVSGGSFTAGYFALSQDKKEFFADFPEAVLHRKLQRNLILRVLAPWNWPRLLSPRFGRSDLATRYYNKRIFEDTTYEELPQRLPFFIINATDIGVGAHFPFTQTHFDRLCSDLSKVQVARAVTSSSAFPGGFTPLTWRNYQGCGYTTPEWVEIALGNDSECQADPACVGDLEVNPRRYDRARVWKSYEDPIRRFIHVMDGGVSDNIGLREPLVAMSSDDSPWSLLHKVNFGEVERLAVIVVDAKPRHHPTIDRRASPPWLLPVLSSAASTPMANYSTDTVELLRNQFWEWDKDAADYDAMRPRCEQFALKACETVTSQQCEQEVRRDCEELFLLTPEDQPPHPELYRIHIRFDAIRDPVLREELQAVGTTLQLPKETVTKLITVGSTLLEQSDEFRKLKAALTVR